ncbi:hypothetical protein [uncultured Pseudodesulfovibrio sp.]|uniref:hypothetical protein n=1 Tax=uncultured Pseudodesulfovibrio sp. TaxID=2035858 RepID=UPI0029C88600|nr:hypothetical protein [uncultured Pseudodesulfovibrio sp.]
MRIRKRFIGRTPATRARDQATPSPDEPARSRYEFLKDRANAVAFGRMADRRDIAWNSELTENTTNIIRHARTRPHQGIGVEPARRHPLHIKISLDFALKLLARPMLLLLPDHSFLRQDQVAPPCFYRLNTKIRMVFASRIQV